MTIATIYHNPRCSKSRETLALLQANNAEVTIIEYLKTPPTTDEIKHILTLLELEPRQMMRTKELEYKQQNLADTALNSQALIAAMVATPKLIERPIVLANGKAIIGRPPENVINIL
ncbi:arsenate reductase (glutaredoxin) [Shewanella intestini]|uniref:Arsenate reductase n=1 Tax=Shewanella intestini TaxID=2017544 RepID=A0ABS5HZ96_9GAMM|nr:MULTISPECIES: arsenate reductase (glutaredoxin) [Shewanella]MBR9727110.1 arsenate reductase (glutaredoxin) [Shewanella intestini]MRG35912.1 arsenate reductase (glutaredoxin) [Shewanella sp. XMDDZSB0408]